MNTVLSNIRLMGDEQEEAIYGLMAYEDSIRNILTDLLETQTSIYKSLGDITVLNSNSPKVRKLLDQKLLEKKTNEEVIKIILQNVTIHLSDIDNEFKESIISLAMKFGLFVIP